MASDEVGLKHQLDGYESELQTVKSCLATITSDDPNFTDLQELKNQLEEVINLTKEQYLELQKQRLYEELGLNSSESTEPQQGSSHQAESADDVDALSKHVEGKRCAVPYRLQSGELGYYNAVIMCLEDCSQDTAAEVKVRVFFCNPVTEKMKPCSYYMKGECKFTDSQCKYSHGYLLPLNSLRDPIEIDIQQLQRDFPCLVKNSSSSLWQKAIVEEPLDNHKYLVKIAQTGGTLEVDLESIAPDFIDSDESDSSETETDEPYLNSQQWSTIDFSASAIGAWETHTRGIGSRLMKKMGYIWGQGLGKESQGRVEPLEPIVYPERKSLDECIAMRNKAPTASGSRKKKKKEKATAKHVANGYHKAKPENVFDFLNSTVCNFKKSSAESENERSTKEDRELSASIKTASDQNLNVEAFKVCEDLKKAESELVRLQNGMKNVDSKSGKSNIRSKLEAKKNVITSLRRKEQMIQNEQRTRNSHKKLTVF